VYDWPGLLAHTSVRVVSNRLRLPGRADAEDRIGNTPRHNGCATTRGQIVPPMWVGRTRFFFSYNPNSGSRVRETVVLTPTRGRRSLKLRREPIGQRAGPERACASLSSSRPLPRYLQLSFRAPILISSYHCNPSPTSCSQIPILASEPGLGRAHANYPFRARPDRLQLMIKLER